MLIERPDWQAHAACHGLTHLFFPEQGEDSSQAKAICRGCEVREQCAEAGHSEFYGVWGGRSTKQRNTIRRAAGVPRVITPRPIVHGVGTGGALAHRRRGEEPCPLCRATWNKYKATRAREIRARDRAATVVQLRPREAS